MKKAAVICAEGLGDSLNMMIASYALSKQGYQVDTYSRQLFSLGKWLPPIGSFPNKPPIEEYERVFSSYDLVVLQHENSERAKTIRSLYIQKKIPHLITFYNNYRISKHDPIKEGIDFAFDESFPMADNVALSMQKLFSLLYPSKALGLSPPDSLTHRKYRKRVVLHPTSTRSEKNWSKPQFYKLCQKLRSAGYTPWITLPEREKEQWKEIESHGVHLPTITSLEESASIFYESGYFIGNDSGPGHLASYLQIPLITISPFHCISHWQPGWFPSLLMKPYPFCPNMKGLRLKEKHWQRFLPVGSVFRNFKKLVSLHP